MTRSVGRAPDPSTGTRWHGWPPGYSHTALSQAANGRRLPSWQCALAYLGACGIADEAEIAAWRADWESTRRAIKLYEATVIGGQYEGGRPETPAAPALPVPPISALPNLPARVTPEATPYPNVQPVDAAVDQPRRWAVSVETTVSDRSTFPAPPLNKLATTAELVTALNEAIEKRGYTVKDLSSRIMTSTLPTLTTALVAGPREVREVLTGQRAPTRPVVQRVVDACGGTDEDNAAWTRVYQNLHEAERRARAELSRLKQIVADGRGDREKTVWPMPNPNVRYPGHGRGGIGTAGPAEFTGRPRLMCGSCACASAPEFWPAASAGSLHF